jgi:peptidylprolyl isomerase
MKLPIFAIWLALGAGPALAAAAPPPAPPSEADWRTPDPQNLLVIDTTKGRIIVEMNPVQAPLAVARVRELTKQGFYDGRAFFRVIDDFMDQTGDPLDNGTGASKLPNLPPEFSFRLGSDLIFTPVTKKDSLDAGILGSLPVISQPIALGALTADGKVGAYASFCPGVAGMARADAADTANSQFYLMRGLNPNLDQKYAVWGRVISGMDVVKAIKTGEPPPPPADKMTKVRMLTDLPPGEQPRVRVIDTQGPWFKAMVARVKAEKVVDFSICDIDLPSDIK